jgi:hypothetical protein
MLTRDKLVWLCRNSYIYSAADYAHVILILDFKPYRLCQARKRQTLWAASKKWCDLLTIR